MIPQDRKRARTDARKLSDHLYRAEGTAMPKYLREASEEARTALETLVWAVNQYERDLMTGRNATELALAGVPQDMPTSEEFDLAEHMRGLADIMRAGNGKVHTIDAVSAYPVDLSTKLPVNMAYGKLAFQGYKFEELGDQYRDAQERFWAEHGTPCPWCKDVFYGSGDPIKKHAEFCEAREEQEENT